MKHLTSQQGHAKCQSYFPVPLPKFLLEKRRNSATASPALPESHCRKNPSKANIQIFQRLVLKAVDDVPDKLKYVCGELSGIAEREAATSSSSDDILRSELRNCAKKYRLGTNGEGFKMF